MSLEGCRDDDFTPGSEMEFPKNHYAVPKGRFPDRLVSCIPADQATPGAGVPRFSLGPIVRHPSASGVTSETGRGLVEVAAAGIVRNRPTGGTTAGIGLHCRE